MRVGSALLLLLVVALGGGTACSLMYDDSQITGGARPEPCSAAKPCADDGNPCTSDACVDSVCQHAALQPGTPCSTSGVCDGDAKCRPGCGVGGRFYAPGDADPDNVCQVCDTNSTRTALSAVADGEPCDDDSNACTHDHCAGGVCVHAPESAGSSCGANNTCDLALACSTGCFIDDRFIDPGTLNPDNPCEACDPSTSITSWTSRPKGIACPDDGDACTLDQCDAGKCTHPGANLGSKCGAGNCIVLLSVRSCSASCWIGGKGAAEGSRDPTDPCRTCQTAITNSKWSPLPDGTVCGPETCGDYGACKFPDVCATNGIKIRSCSDQTCGSGTCRAVSQDESAACTRPSTDGTTCEDDANPCTGDVCQGDGCTHPELAPGTDCGAGMICDGNGACLTGCYIDGAIYADGAKNPANACQVCAASSWTTGWSNGPC